MNTNATRKRIESEKIGPYAKLRAAKDSRTGKFRTADVMQVLSEIAREQAGGRKYQEATYAEIRERKRLESVGICRR